MKKAIYPGSFDPITLGHLDIIKRSLKLTDELIIGVGVNNEKNYMFSKEKRIDMIRKSIENDLQKEELQKIKIDFIEGLLVDYLKRMQVKIVIRGIRAFSDF